MAKVLRTDLAEGDLVEIWLFVAGDNVKNADALIDLIVDKADVLSNSPEVGRSREEVAAGVRSFPVGRYVIFYQIIDRGILILRVLHGARDVDGLF